MQPGKLTKMCLNETYNKVCTVKNLPDSLPIQNGLKRELCFRTFRHEGPRK